jgi:hypothetical protein
MWWCERDKAIVGHGLLNSVINNLPFEMHLPGYQFCGPGTNLEKRLARGDAGVNPLDSACKTHDIAYSKFKDDGPERFEADKLLSSEAWNRVKSFDAGIGERAAALAVTAAMKAKMGLSRIGKGISKGKRKLKKKRTALKKGVKNIKSFTALVKATRKKMSQRNRKSADTVDGIVNSALAAAKEVKKKSKTPILQPRVIPIPKTGGLLPIIPPIAALSALGSLISTVSTIKSALSKISEARQKRVTDAVPIGSGLYLKPYRKGYGLYLQPYKKNF